MAFVRATGKWVKLFILLRLACEYYGRYKTKLPSDLPAPIIAACVALENICSIMDDYEQSHPGGKI